jgi:carbonic anhydrase/acetyltransferase-like protein (isoleucine patch superfamily)
MVGVAVATGTEVGVAVGADILVGIVVEVGSRVEITEDVFIGTGAEVDC